MARLLRLLPDSAKSSRTSKRGSVEDCVCIFGGSGEPGKTASENYAIAAYRSSMRRWRPARPRASGECQGTHRSNRRCATAISTRSVFPESMCPPKPNSIEPPRYGPVCAVVWEGRCREAPHYPDLAQIAVIDPRHDLCVRPRRRMVGSGAARRRPRARYLSGSIVHTAHAAAARHGRSLLLRMLRHHGLGCDHETGD